MPTRRYSVSTAAGLIAALCVPGWATAAPDYVIVASACTPTAATIQSNAYYTSNFRIKLRPRKTIATFVCPITNRGDGYWQRFYVTWHDPDGTGNDYKLSASLMRRKFNGLDNEVIALALRTGTGTCRSTANPMTCSLTINHTPEFGGYYYWVAIHLSRVPRAVGQLTFNAIKIE